MIKTYLMCVCAVFGLSALAGDRLFMNEDCWHFWMSDSGEGFSPLKPGIGATARCGTASCPRACKNRPRAVRADGAGAMMKRS